MPGNPMSTQFYAAPDTAGTINETAPAKRGMTLEFDIGIGIGIGHRSRYVVLLDENARLFVSAIASNDTPIDAIHSAVLAAIGADFVLAVLTVKSDLMELSGLREALEHSLPGVRIEIQHRSSAVPHPIERKLRKAIKAARTAS